jgi:DnaJ like chaperone protein
MKLVFGYFVYRSMQIYIKWLFMIIGGFRFGAPGAIIGFFIGYIVEEIVAGQLEFKPKSTFRGGTGEFVFSQYQNNLLFLISSLMKADGVVSKEKIIYIKNYLYKQFGSMYGSRMMMALKNHLNNHYRVDVIAAELRYMTAPQGKLNLFRFLHGITIQNGILHPEERSILEKIAMNMGITQSDFFSVINGNTSSGKSSFQHTIFNQTEDSFKILGLTNSATDDEVKKAYRKLVLKYHPDRTELDEKTATEKFNRIQQAYERIKKSRNLK